MPTETISRQLWETKIDFNFKVVKLLDYSDRSPELETSPNPFAIVVVAHLKAQETRSNRLERKRWKLILVRRLYEQNYSRTEVINLFHFIDWVMSLPEELEQEFWQAVQELEKERSMPYVTSVQRNRTRSYPISSCSRKPLRQIFCSLLSSRTFATKHHLSNYLRYRTGETSQVDTITQLGLTHRLDK